MYELTKQEAINMLNRIGLLIERIKFDSKMNSVIREVVIGYKPNDILEEVVFAIENDDSEGWTRLLKSFGLSPEPKGARTRLTTN